MNKIEGSTKPVSTLADGHVYVIDVTAKVQQIKFVGMTFVEMATVHKFLLEDCIIYLKRRKLDFYFNYFLGFINLIIYN